VKWETMVSYLKHLNRCCKKIIIYPEFAASGRLHCHGIIWVSDMIKWHKSVRPLLKRNGMLLVKEIDDIDKWVDYIIKDAKDTRGILAPSIIPLTLFNLRDELVRIRYKYQKKFEKKGHIKNMNMTVFFPVD